MKKIIKIVIAVIIAIACSVVGFISGFKFDQNQLETLKILAIIAGSSVLYCFIVGEISRNNSQMDKLWSILPIAYAWVIAAKGNMHPRLVVMAVLITLWGIRLTMNFARKGAYSIKFWTGVEDYRWVYLRGTKVFSNKVTWAFFDFFFISLYQNALVLAICLPMVAVMSSTEAFGVADYIVAAVAFLFIVYEAIADEQQMKFQNTKWKMIHEGKKLEELPEPYRKGFNTKGLWCLSRHPNYCGEQAFWIAIYFFVIGAKVVQWGIFNWSMFACMFLVLLFIGSSTFSENVSSKKYPLYKDYQKKVFKYLPVRKYHE